jgi:hypothetical protein
VIAELLAAIEDLITDDAERAKYKNALDALDNIKESKSAAKRIEAVKDLLPSSLRPNKKNPLAILHDALSVGLHGESDETCLGWAVAIRTSLIYLLEQVHDRKQSAQRFDKSMDEIMAKVAKVGETKTDVK